MFPPPLVERVLSTVCDRTCPDPPSAAELQSLLRACFQASLRTEEGRRTPFTVAFVAPGGTRPAMEQPGWWLLPFAGPRTLDARELSKLAPALLDREARIGIRRREPYDRARTPLVLWGALLTGSSMWDLQMGRTMQGSAIGPPYLCIEVNHPGVMTVHGPAGSIPLLGDEPRSGDRFSLIRVAWSRPWVGFLRAERGEWRTHWARTVGLVLHAIRDGGHGGAVFILEATEVPATVDVKYRIDPPTQLLAIAAASAEQAEAGANNAAVAKVTTPELPDDVVHLMASAASVQQHSWRQAAETVARLANVDGAVLLTRGLAVRGFGAVVQRVGVGSRMRVVVARDLDAHTFDKLDLSRFGTRHRSAAAFCMRNPGGVAFVVSQDGDISGMRFVDGRVVVWAIEPGGERNEVDLTDADIGGGRSPAPRNPGRVRRAPVAATSRHHRANRR